MDVKSSDSDSKTNTFFAACSIIFNTIIIKNTVVDPFNGSSGFHFFSPGIAASRDSGKQAQIPIRFGIDNPAIFRGRAAITGVTRLALAANTRTAPLQTAAVMAKSPINHLVSARTNRDAVIIKSKMRRIFKVALVAVVNEQQIIACRKKRSQTDNSWERHVIISLNQTASALAVDAMGLESVHYSAEFREGAEKL